MCLCIYACLFMCVCANVVKRRAEQRQRQYVQLTCTDDTTLYHIHTNRYRYDEGDNHLLGVSKYMSMSLVVGF